MMDVVSLPVSWQWLVTIVNVTKSIYSFLGRVPERGSLDQVGLGDMPMWICLDCIN